MNRYVIKTNRVEDLIANRRYIKSEFTQIVKNKT
jgi:hypothetical protein